MVGDTIERDHQIGLLEQVHERSGAMLLVDSPFVVQEPACDARYHFVKYVLSHVTSQLEADI